MEREVERTVPSTAAIAGHPIHPMLIPFPIAFLTGALATDLAFTSTADAFWARASLWLLGAGSVTGALSAVAGLVDFLTLRRVRSLASGWAHLIGNAAALGIAFANWLERIGRPESFISPGGWILSALTVALLGVTGWLGGQLAYRHGIGVSGPRR